MNLPGFTADTSLLQVPGFYQQSASFPRGNGGEIYPQFCAPIQGWRKEDLYVNCTVRCRAAGGTVSGCKTACCRQITGYYCCYIA